MKKKNRFILICVLFSFVSLQAKNPLLGWYTNTTEIIKKYPKTTAVLLLSIASGYGMFKYLRTPEKFVPNEENIDLTILNKNKTKDSDTVFLFSHGVDPRSNIGIRQAKEWIKNGIITGPCVTFNYGDSLRRLNFGQQIDSQCVQVAHEFAKEKFPNKKIVFACLSRGCNAMITYLSENPETQKNVAALIMESPYTDMKSVAHHIAKNYIWWFPNAKQIFYSLIKNLPNYNSEFPTAEEQIKKINDIPTFLIYSTADKTVPPQETKKLGKILQENKKTAIVELQSGRHSKLSYNEKFRKKVTEFLNHYL